MASEARRRSHLALLELAAPLDAAVAREAIAAHKAQHGRLPIVKHWECGQDKVEPMHRMLESARGLFEDAATRQMAGEDVGKEYQQAFVETLGGSLGAAIASEYLEWAGCFEPAPDYAATLYGGALATLEDVVAFYSRGVGRRERPAPAETVLEPLDLTPEQEADLVLFLRCLTSTAAPQILSPR